MLLCKPCHLASLKECVLFLEHYKAGPLMPRVEKYLVPPEIRNYCLPKRDRFLKTHLPRMTSLIFSSCTSADSTFLSSEVTMMSFEGLSSWLWPMCFFPTKLGKEGGPCLQPFQGAVRLRVIKINAKTHKRSYLHGKKQLLIIASI